MYHQTGLLPQRAQTSSNKVLKVRNRGMSQTTTAGRQPTSSSSSVLRGNQTRSQQTATTGRMQFPLPTVLISQAPGAPTVMGSCTAHQFHGPPVLLRANELLQPLTGGPGAAERFGAAAPPERSKAPCSQGRRPASQRPGSPGFKAWDSPA